MLSLEYQQERFLTADPGVNLSIAGMPLKILISKIKILYIKTPVHTCNKKCTQIHKKEMHRTTKLDNHKFTDILKLILNN